MLTNETCTVECTDNPTVKTIMIAGIADNLMFKNIITVINWISVATALNTTSIAAQHDNNKIPTQINVAHSAANMISERYVLNVIYCSQNMNGIPDG